MSPRIAGIRLDMLLYLYRRRVRAHPLAELLAGSGVAVGVALVFGVLLANSSLTSSASGLIHALAGNARYELIARSSQGVSERVVREAGELEAVQVASPVLRENVTLRGAGGEQAVQLIGLSPSLEALGGAWAQQLNAGAALLKGGLALPSGVAGRLRAHRGSVLAVAGRGRLREAPVRLLLSDALPGVSASPVAVAVLGVAQRLAGRPGAVTEVLILPRPGAAAAARAELGRLAAAHGMALRPASEELALLSMATRPNRQSTSLFTAIAVMIGFLLALNAVLLTVPERRRFVTELRMQGYDAIQVFVLLALQALVLGVVASLVGLALGWELSHAFFQQVPGFLTAAFPIGAQETVSAVSVGAAMCAGLLASLLASLSPLLDLRGGAGAGGIVHRKGAVRSEAISHPTMLLLALVGSATSLAAVAMALLAPGLTIGAGVALAVACVCLVPVALWGVSAALGRTLERVRSSALIVALTEMRVVTTRSVALAAIVGLAVYGGIAIGGARQDLLRGIDRATAQYFATGQVWVTAGRDVFNTNGFDPRQPVAAIARVPGVASVRVYRGGLLDVGDRRMWVRARPERDSAVLESSQLLHGDYVSASRSIRAGGWAAVSSDFADERNLHVGSTFTLPAPLSTAHLRVAAITTNSGWPAGTITIGASTYRRLWGGSEAAAIEVSLRSGVSEAAGRRAVAAALGAGSGLQAMTASERVAQSAASARQGLHTLKDISSLLLVAAALSVASALSAAIWQRRARLAALKIQGYDTSQLWRAVLFESGVTIGVGALLGALVGIGGHALASRFLQLSTGFPAPFAVGPVQVLLTIALFCAIALAVMAMPGMVAARIPPRAVLQE